MYDNKLYDFLKTFTMITLPATTAVYLTVGNIKDLSNFVQVGVTIATINVVLGIVVGMSSKRWNRSESKYDGEIAIVGNDSDTGMPNLQLIVTSDPNGFADKGTILLKSVDRR